jgi:hypothetical protein
MNWSINRDTYETSLAHYSNVIETCLRHEIDGNATNSFRTKVVAKVNKPIAICRMNVIIIKRLSCDTNTFLRYILGGWERVTESSC